MRIESRFLLALAMVLILVGFSAAVAADVGHASMTADQRLALTKQAVAETQESPRPPHNPLDDYFVQDTTYSWIDMTGATTVTMQDDDNQGPFGIGFTFSYYGNSYTTMRINSNGSISPTDANTSNLYNPITAPCLPSTGTPNNTIYGWWGDLDPSSTGGGTIKYRSDAAQGRFIVAWENVPYWTASGPAGSYTFQIVVRSDGVILLNYGSLAAGQYQDSCFAGIENSNGTEAIQLWCCNGQEGTPPVSNTAKKFWNGPNQAITGIVRHLGGANPPLAGAWVRVGTDSVQTDSAGNYDLYIDPGTYSVSFRHPQHCDSTRTNVIVEPDVNTTLNVSMRSPNATLSATSLTFVVHQNQTEPQTFTIQNVGGSCPLSFQITDTVAWLSSNPASGTVNPGQTETITVTAAPGNLQPNEMHTSMDVVCNAPGSPFVIQVDMNVLNVGQGEPGLPTEFALHGNYPNPFNPTTTLPFDVSRTSQVDITIYNVMGQEVARPVSGVYAAGRYQLTFDAGDMPSGLYLVKMNAGSFTALRKIMLLK